MLVAGHSSHDLIQFDWLGHEGQDDCLNSVGTKLNAVRRWCIAKAARYHDVAMDWQTCEQEAPVLVSDSASRELADTYSGTSQGAVSRGILHCSTNDTRKMAG